mgnify:CR=1 FL=1
MPQLDLMTFEIQGLSILLTFLCLFFYFYINVLHKLRYLCLAVFFYKILLSRFKIISIKIKKLKMIF